LKLSKTSWIILSIGIFVIAFASLGFTRLQQVKEQDLVQEELSLAESRLSSFQFEQYLSQLEELEEQLNDTLAESKSARLILAQQIESIPSTETLFDIADDCEVGITVVSSSGLSGNVLESISCSALSITVNAEGDVPSLIAFVIKLNSDFKTGAVRSVNIVIPEDTTVELPVATIQMIIYSYQGD